MITVESKGGFDKTKSYLNRLLHGDIFSDLDSLGAKGAEALARATPVDTGLAANSWKYQVVRTSKYTAIEWYNTDVEGGSNVIILLQYGHGTGTGGYVAGRDFINPAIQPIFDEIATRVWKRVTS